MKLSITNLARLSLLASFFATINHCCDISGLDKAVVIRALYAQAKPLGMGWLHYDASDILSDSEVEKVIKEGSVDYLKGRVMKIRFRDNTFETLAYNRDNGTQAAETVIAALRKQAENTEGKKK